MKVISRRGRPAGDAGDRKLAIAKAAIELFSTLGYDKTSIRQIAERANVDSRLISHYFGSKPALFAAVLTLPPQADSAIEIFKKNEISTWGAKIADLLFDGNGLLNVPQMIGVIKSASNEPEVADVIREFYLKQSLEPILDAIGLTHAKVRASAMSSLIVGFTFSDQIIKIPAGTNKQADDRKTLFAQLAQTILTQDFG